MPLLQLIVLDYHSAEWIGRSLESAAHGSSLWPRVHCTVVDNSVDDEAHRQLLDSLPEGVEVVRAEENLGFARGCNTAARRSEAPYLLFANPDSLWPAGAFDALAERIMQRGDRALIGPQQYAEESLHWRHAPLRGVRLFDEAWDLAFVRGLDTRRPDRLIQARDRGRRSHSPIRVRALSGGCLGMSRRLFEDVGRWDEGFWMYGEDVELSVRARKHGYICELHHDIPFVHYMERSAKRLPERVEAAREAGRMRFKAKHHSRMARSIERGVHRLVERALPHRSDPFATPSSGLPMTFRRPADAERWAVEIGRSPLFDNCLTRFAETEEEITAPLSMLRGLPEAQCFARVAAFRRGTWHTESVHGFFCEPSLLTHEPPS